VNPTAVLLVLGSGFLHATWNFMAKSSKDKLSFLWAAKVLALFLLSPLFLYYLFDMGGIARLNGSILEFIAFGLASGLVHFGYNYFLSLAYRYGDISFTYPIARGLAPFLVALFSFFFIGETPSVSGAAGMTLVAFGTVFLVNSKRNNDSGSDEAEVEEVSPFKQRAPLIFAGLTAITIALYLFLDGNGARRFTPFLFMYSYSFVSTVLLSLVILRRREKLFREVQINLKSICATGVMMPLSYFLALSAMELAQLGYVASFRNVSVVFATLFGFFLLGEEFTLYRVVGSLFIFLGAVSLGLG